MKVHAFDNEGFLTASFDAQVDQLESKARGQTVYLVPPYATVKPPPAKLAKGEAAQWNGRDWVVSKTGPKVKELKDPNERNRVNPEATQGPERDPKIDEQLKARYERVLQIRENLKTARTDGITDRNLRDVLKDLVELVLGE